MQEMQDTWIQSLGEEDPLEQKITTHSSILAWEIPRTEEPGRLKFEGSQRVGHDWIHTHTYTHVMSMMYWWVSIYIFHFATCFLYVCFFICLLFVNFYFSFPLSPSFVMNRYFLVCNFNFLLQVYTFFCFLT